MLLSKLQLEQYEDDGYIIPDFKMPEYLLKKIEERHDKLLESHPEFKNYCPAILHYDEILLYGIQVFLPSLLLMVMQLPGIKMDNIGQLDLWQHALYGWQLMTQI